MGNFICLFLVNVIFLLFASWLFQLFGEGKLLVACLTHWFKCCRLHFAAQPHRFPSIYGSARARDIHGATMEKLCSGRVGGGFPGSDTCRKMSAVALQVMSGSFLSGKSRSHPEGANWVRTRSISRSSRALTTAKSWWRTSRCTSSLQSQGQGSQPLPLPSALQRTTA